MASITKTTTKTGDVRWRARWRTPEGGSREQWFDRKVDAEAHLATVEVKKLTGEYVDRSAGLVTVEAYAEAWRGIQAQHRASTAAQVEGNLRRHVYPTLGARPIGAVRTSEVQALVKKLSETLAPGTVGTIYSYVAAVFASAVQDRLIASTPCQGIKLPKVEPTKVEPPTIEQVEALIGGIGDRYRAAIVLAAGSGLRQGEVFGLTVDRVDFLRRTVTVDRQLVLLPGGEPSFGPPKTKASYRTVPVPKLVTDALAEQLARFGPGPDGLIFTNDRGAAIRRTRFSDRWRPVAKAAGLAPGTGMHALRHFYASALIRHGESVKVVQSRLGHATAAETLDTYSHLWPDSEDRTRAAIEAVLGISRGAVVGLAAAD